MDKVISHQKLPTSWNERESLREKGQFWTPSWVANAMIKYVAENTKLIFDPATGRGAFFKALLECSFEENIRFYGTDIDDEVLVDDIYKNDLCFVEKRDFIKNPPDHKFMAIAANPPYIRHHRINSLDKIELKRLCYNITGFIIDGRAGYHIYFLLQALSLLDENGRLAFIMPSDTCEGVFAKKLWNWISEKFCIEAVITFDEQATPFPKVDTNAVVFFIKKTKPSIKLLWCLVNKSYSNDLYEWVCRGFKENDYLTLKIQERELKEALTTGLSRPKQKINSNSKYKLSDFAKVIRGIATGSNDYFFLNDEQVKKYDIPASYLKKAIGRTKDVNGESFLKSDFDNLRLAKRPTYLFYTNGHIEFPNSVVKYLQIGEQLGLPDKPLIKQRKPWHKTEQREVPPLLFAYLGRREIRFIKNEAGVVPLSCFLCVFPILSDEIYINKLWKALNHPDTISNLKLVGKSYGSGATKVEPNNLRLLPIPDHVVDMFDLISLSNVVRYKQEDLNFNYSGYKQSQRTVLV